MHRIPSLRRIVPAIVIGAMLALTGVIVPLHNVGAQSAASHPRALPVLNLNINTGDADFVKTLDPGLPTDSISYYDIQLVNANLVKPLYPSLNVVPDLATWKVSKNHRVYTFTIRANAKFANGDPVTAADAAWSLTRALLPSSKSPVAALYLGPIKGAAELAAGKAHGKLSGVKVLGPRTLQITLTGPYAYFLNSLTYPTADVLDKRTMVGKKVDTYLDNNCRGNNGAGPFEFVCAGGSGHNSFFPAGHTPYFDFKPNPNYYGAKAHVMIHAPFIADSDTQWRLYRSGAIDATSVPTADIGIAKHLSGYSQRPALETDYITPNRAEAPFNNVNCRLAVAYGINRYAITEQLLKGIEAPLYDVLPPGLPQGGQGYFGSGQKEGVPYYNPNKAKAYLNACPGGLKGVTLTYQKTSADLTHEYDAITFELNQLGANITLKPLTFNDWLNVVGQSMTVTKTQITENLWIDDYPDAQDWMAQLLQTGANYDIGGFSNHAYDQLVNQGNVTFNVAKRAALYRRAQKIALNDGAWIGVGWADTPWVVRKSLKGIIYTNGNIYPQNNDWSNAS